MSGRLRHIALLCSALLAALLALWPRFALACNPIEVDCTIENGMHAVMVRVMELLWVPNRMLLLTARWIEDLRGWLVTGVLGSAFDTVVAGIQFPFWILAGVAWMVFVGGYLLQSYVDMRWVDLRRGLLYAFLALFLFQYGSQAVAVTEQGRLWMSQGISGIAAQSSLNATTTLEFRADNDSTIPTPHTIYGSGSSCPGMGLARVQQAMFLLDYVANYLWAEAADIHCPARVQGQAALPDIFARGDNAFQGYVPRFPISDESQADRQRLIGLANEGIVRLLIGLFLSIAAVLEQILHLFFAVALATVWLGLLLALLVALFLPTEGIFRAQINAMLNVCKTSWIAAFWLGIMLSLIYQAALSGNGMVVAGMGLLTSGMIVWQLKQAAQALVSTLDVVGSTVGVTPSAFGSAARSMVIDGALLAGALATGGGAAALTMATRQTFGQMGDSTLGRAAGKALGTKAGQVIHAWDAEHTESQEALRATREQEWYASGAYQGAGTPAADKRAAGRVRTIEMEQLQSQLKQTQRHIGRAREREEWDRADVLQQRADALAQQIQGWKTPGTADDSDKDTSNGTGTAPRQTRANGRAVPSAADAAHTQQRQALRQSFWRLPQEHVAMLSAQGDLIQIPRPTELPDDAMLIPNESVDPGAALQAGFALGRTADSKAVAIYDPRRPADAQEWSPLAMATREQHLVASGSIVGALAEKIRASQQPARPGRPGRTGTQPLAGSVYEAPTDQLRGVLAPAQSTAQPQQASSEGNAQPPAAQATEGTPQDNQASGSTPAQSGTDQAASDGALQNIQSQVEQIAHGQHAIQQQLADLAAQNSTASAQAKVEADDVERATRDGTAQTTLEQNDVERVMRTGSVPTTLEQQKMKHMTPATASENSLAEMMGQLQPLPRPTSITEMPHYVAQLTADITAAEQRKREMHATASARGFYLRQTGQTVHADYQERRMQERIQLLDTRIEQWREERARYEAALPQGGSEVNLPAVTTRLPELTQTSWPMTVERLQHAIQETEADRALRSARLHDPTKQQPLVRQIERLDARLHAYRQQLNELRGASPLPASSSTTEEAS